LKNCTDIIKIIVFSRGVDFQPVEFALICDAWLVISHSFSAFFFGVIKYFAVTAKFAIA